jgi:hypothetical protein
MDEKYSARRRVYVPELKARTGYSSEWLRQLERNGRIPKARVDPGGKRKFWLDDEADKIVAGE